MIVNLNLLLTVNPFYDAYINSDFLGKFIFIVLILISVVSWVILIHKILITQQARKNSSLFQDSFKLHKVNPLGLDGENLNKNLQFNPFLQLYLVLKKHTIEILNKNRRFGAKEEKAEGHISYLSPTDLSLVESHLYTAIASQTKHLEKNLYILSTIVSLAPFLGLLGTVWGILTTFSEMQSQAVGSSHQMVLSGLSLALATTVLGLIDAIPALIGYNYLKNGIRDFNTEMEEFANEILASVEMQYRKVDVHK
jgi:biopolymer transport protein TolQ